MSKGQHLFLGVACMSVAAWSVGIAAEIMVSGHVPGWPLTRGAIMLALMWRARYHIVKHEAVEGAS